MKANELSTNTIVKINPEIVERFENQEEEMLLVKGGVYIHIGKLNILNCSDCSGGKNKCNEGCNTGCNSCTLTTADHTTAN